MTVKIRKTVNRNRKGAQTPEQKKAWDAYCKKVGKTMARDQAADMRMDLIITQGSADHEKAQKAATAWEKKYGDLWSL